MTDYVPMSREGRENAKSKLEEGLGKKVRQVLTREVRGRYADSMRPFQKEMVTGVILDDGTEIKPSSKDPNWLEVERTCNHFGVPFLDFCYPDCSSYKEACQMVEKRKDLPLALR